MEANARQGDLSAESERLATIKRLYASALEQLAAYK
jgi:hypothetical protein